MPLPAPAASAAPAVAGGSQLLFQFIVKGDDVSSMLLSLDHAISPRNLAFWMQSFVVNQHFKQQIEKRFRDEGSPGVGKWAPLSDATVQIREALGFPGDHPINRRTNQLYDFVTSASEMIFDADQVVARIPGEVSDPITEQKLRTAQRGSRKNPLASAGPTPARPVLAVETDDVATILTSLQYAIIANVQFRLGKRG